MKASKEQVISDSFCPLRWKEGVRSLEGEGNPPTSRSDLLVVVGAYLGIHGRWRAS